MITILAIIVAAYLLTGIAVASWVLLHTPRERTPGTTVHPAVLVLGTVLVWPWTLHVLARAIRDYEAEQERESQS
ncbi:MAG TPA: hypothetical protein VE155_06565 [Pseudonocardiaceae bacterium]|jgi:multisubunit Na+/H+ antiporter MnhG subunit|nr:hypothetical protein [Pseudonocardiaceae bacterium]